MTVLTLQRRIEVEEFGDVIAVRLCEQNVIDPWEIETLGKELYRLVDRGVFIKMILNFSAVEFLSSHALGKLICLRRKMAARNGEIKLCSINENIEEIFSICRLDRLFDIQANEFEALAAFCSAEVGPGARAVLLR